jgi:hypothetical protein
MTFHNWVCSLPQSLGAGAPTLIGTLENNSLWKSNLPFGGRSVGQCVLISGRHPEPAINFSFSPTTSVSNSCFFPLFCGTPPPPEKWPDLHQDNCNYMNTSGQTMLKVIAAICNRNCHSTYAFLKL